MDARKRAVLIGPSTTLSPCRLRTSPSNASIFADMASWAAVAALSCHVRSSRLCGPSPRHMVVLEGPASTSVPPCWPPSSGPGEGGMESSAATASIRPATASVRPATASVRPATPLHQPRAPLLPYTGRTCGAMPPCRWLTSCPRELSEVCLVEHDGDAVAVQLGPPDGAVGMPANDGVPAPAGRHVHRQAGTQLTRMCYHAPLCGHLCYHAPLCGHLWGNRVLTSSITTYL